ncbi:hypothetical protein NBRC116588_32060 [Pyruvatibacter sp. HU-CL02332]
MRLRSLRLLPVAPMAVVQSARLPAAPALVPRPIPAAHAVPQNAALAVQPKPTRAAPAVRLRPILAAHAVQHTNQLTD